jgi:hypothetical protein
MKDTIRKHCREDNNEKTLREIQINYSKNAENIQS